MKIQSLRSSALLALGSGLLLAIVGPTFASISNFSIDQTAIRPWTELCIGTSATISRVSGSMTAKSSLTAMYLKPRY